MSRYIDADEFKKDLIHLGFFPALVARALEKAPTADVVEVVRCKNCRYWKEYCIKDEVERLYLERLWGFPISITSTGIGKCCCEHWKFTEHYDRHKTDENDYCSYGKRRTKDE